MNEEPALKSSLHFTLTQHPFDENFELQKMHARLKIHPLQAWYYRISTNFHTLMILLQVNFVSGNELEIIWEGCYKTDDTFIFAWSSILSIGHYRWLCGPICQMLHNVKANSLVYTIWHILKFLQLWTIIMA